MVIFVIENIQFVDQWDVHHCFLTGKKFKYIQLYVSQVSKHDLWSRDGINNLMSQGIIAAFMIFITYSQLTHPEADKQEYRSCASNESYGKENPLSLFCAKVLYEHEVSSV